MLGGADLEFLKGRMWRRSYLLYGPHGVRRQPSLVAVLTVLTAPVAQTFSTTMSHLGAESCSRNAQDRIVCTTDFHTTNPRGALRRRTHMRSW